MKNKVTQQFSVGDLVAINMNVIESKLKNKKLHIMGYNSIKELNKISKLHVVTRISRGGNKILYILDGEDIFQEDEIKCILGGHILYYIYRKRTKFIEVFYNVDKNRLEQYIKKHKDWDLVKGNGIANIQKEMITRKNKYLPLKVVELNV